MTTAANTYNAQLNADRLLTKHFNNTNVARRSPSRRNVPIVNTHFSTYTAALAKSLPSTQDNYPMLTSPPPFTIQRSHTISFSSNSKDDIIPPPLQKRKVISDTNSLVTNTNSESTMTPVTRNNTFKTDFKEEVKAMLGEMKVEIMTQVDAAIKIQVSSVLEEMKFQMKVMFTKMVKEIISLSRENPSSFTNEEQNSDDISYEEEQDDEDMESLTSEEDIDLYTD